MVSTLQQMYILEIEVKGKFQGNSTNSIDDFGKT